jgi:hypothetical protein
MADTANTPVADIKSKKDTVVKPEKPDDEVYKKEELVLRKAKDDKATAFVSCQVPSISIDIILTTRSTECDQGQAESCEAARWFASRR